MFTKLLRAVLAGSAVLCIVTSHAQEPTLDLLSDGLTIIGIVNQADGNPAAGVNLSVQDLTNSQRSATSVTADSAGIFVYEGEELTDYRVSGVTQGRPVSATVRTGAAPPTPFQWPPIYVTLGLLMLLSLIPAHFLKR